MSKEIRAKKRCPTVIARLLGKERLSLGGHVNKQQPKMVVPSNQSDVPQKSRQSDDFSNSRSSSNREGFKDVYEDLGTSNCNRRSSTKWSAKAMLTKQELALIQQNAEASSSRGSRRVTRLEPSDAIENESNSKAWNLTDTCITSPLLRRDGLLLEPRNSRSEDNTRARKIVVLKPNFQNTRNGIVLKRTNDNPKSIEARQLARTVTRRLKDRYASLDASLDVKGYEGDVESDAFRFSSRKSVGNSKLCRYPPSSCFAESSTANKQAEKRTCERWKTTQKYQDLKLSAADITLGEMLATDRGRRSICISSNDGWIVEKSNTSSRSILLPPSRDKRKYRVNDDIRKMDEFSNRGSKSMNRKFPHCPKLFINETESYLEASFEIKMEANVKDTSAQHQMLKMAPNNDNRKLTADKGVVIKEATNDKASQNQKDSVHRQEIHGGSKAEASSSSKVVDCGRASLVSVLPELSFPGDNASPSSAYQCLQRARAELDELRMQLESLMIQSGDIASMDEGFVEFSPIPYEGNYALRAENWETVYALDVLISSGFENGGFDMFKTNWHSPDFPLDPTLFDDLENKYNGGATGLWSERKFLFDGINFALVEIFQEHLDISLWVTRKLTGALNCLKQKDWCRMALEDKMNEYYMGCATSERELDRETQWSDCKGEIRVIGNEIEGSLIDDMIAELFFKL